MADDEEVKDEVEEEDAQRILRINREQNVYKDFHVRKVIFRQIHSVIKRDAIIMPKNDVKTLTDQFKSDQPND